MKFICRTSIIQLSSVFLISSAVFASSNPQSNCSYGGSQSECTTYGRKPLTELELMQLGQMNAQAAAAEAQRGMAAQREAEARAAAQKIEQEAKAKWCSDTLANIPIAISRCKSDARSTYSRNLYYICRGETSRTIEGNITVYIFGGTVSSTTSCSGTYEAERDATISRCETDGLIIESAVTAQCKG